MKHVGCRMFENDLKPFDNTLKYLNGESANNHLKVIIQIKPYSLFGIDSLYKGPFISIVSDKLLNDVFAVCGWFTVKNLSFNYLYEWNINLENSISQNPLKIDVIDYSDFEESFEIRKETLAEDYGNIVEALEFYPFKAMQDEFKIYEYFKNKNIY